MSDANIYYSPEKFGLTPIAEIELSSGSYEFDIVAAWKDEAGNLLWASDSGCSCPTPFDGDSLATLTRGTPAELGSYVDSCIADSYRDYAAAEMQRDAIDFKAKVRAALAA